jgi:predicted glycosyltransferase
VLVWIDISNSPQVLFFRPLIDLLQARGHEVSVTTRAYAQTLELLDLHGVDHVIVGPPHGGASTWGKGLAFARRLRALRHFAGQRPYDLAFSHASHELPLVARSLGIPSAYAFDYEFARAQHGVGCRAAERIVVPEVIPEARLRTLGAGARKVRRYPGLKEEYYLAGFEPNVRVLDDLHLDRERVLAVVRTPPEVSLYHRHGNPLFSDVLRRLGSDPSVQTVVLPRTVEQRHAIASLGLAGIRIAERAVDAHSLVALADLVVSAGGTMNREAVALGLPVYTIFAGRMGAVDEALVHGGRLLLLHTADQLRVEKRFDTRERVRRDPAVLLDLLLTALEV